jgi:hypothetical protein
VIELPSFLLAVSGGVPWCRRCASWSGPALVRWLFAWTRWLRSSSVEFSSLKLSLDRDWRNFAEFEQSDYFFDRNILSLLWICCFSSAGQVLIEPSWSCLYWNGLESLRQNKKMFSILQRNFLSVALCQHASLITCSCCMHLGLQGCQIFLVRKTRTRK